jgi:uncharacterized protein (TIRG00374 family)
MGTSVVAVREGSRPRRWLALGISLVALGFLGALAYDRLPAVVSVLGGARLDLLAAACLVNLLALYVYALRIGLVFDAFGMRRSSRQFFGYTLIGLFFTNFLPTFVGGDLVKATYAAGQRDRLGDALLATLADRCLGALGLLAFAGVGLMSTPELRADPRAPLLPAALALLVVGVIVARRARARIERLLARLESAPGGVAAALARPTRAAVRLARRPRALSAGMALTIVGHVLVATVLWLTGAALGFAVSPVALLFALPAMTFASLLPSASGWGVREATLVALLAGTLTVEDALSLALLLNAVGLICSIVGGLVFAFRGPLGLRAETRVTGDT